VSLITKEIERRTAHTVLARPVSRWTFVTGKYVGLVVTLLVNAGVMSAGFLLLLAWRGDPVLQVLPALWLIAVELAVVTAFALFFSAVSTSSIVGILFTLGLFVAGHLVWSLPLLAGRLTAAWARGVVWMAYYILPNLDRFNLRAAAVHGDPTPAGYVLAQTLYGIGWAVILVLAASFAFSRRDLT
ncbi:MAG: ABC transporter permease, partial [Acidobacteriota bacterium]